MSTKKRPGQFALGDSVSYFFKYKSIVVGVVVEVLQKECILETPIGKHTIKKNALYHWDDTAASFWSKRDLRIVQSKKQVR